MKGTKYLTELIDEMGDEDIFQKPKLNIIRAPTGCGKTYFALNYIPSHCKDAIHSVVYLIDTINGKEQIISNYNAVSEYWGWAKGIDNDGGMWFDDDRRIVVLTYAKFGILSHRYAEFHKHFDYIICDELHSLFHFQNFSPKPNWHSIALMGVRAAVRNNRTTVIALSATPAIIKRDIGTLWQEIPIDQERLIQFDQKQVIPYTNLEYILSGIEEEIGLCYTARISQMLEIERMAQEMGFSPVCIWSTANKAYPMTEEQLSVRESILKEYKIPEAYNFLIINASAETSIKIKSPVDFVIVNSTNQDTQVQVRGRVNGDLNNLYLLNDGTQPIDLPDEFLNVRLFNEGKERVCGFANLKNPYRKQYKWPTVKELLEGDGYVVSEGRQDDKRYAVISLPAV